MKRSFVLWLVCGMWYGAAMADDSMPRVPEGFTVEKVAAAPLVEHPLMAGLDDRGRLYVAESAGMNLKAAELLANPPNFIRRLEDIDGDGVFDKSTIFADKMTFPQGALWYRDALYVASPPYIWKLKDTDDDGVADERTILVKSFGFTGNAADIHGCFLGPNGRIYWCDGRHGHEFFDEQGNLTSKGKAARIFSCRPDGSDVRVHCGGGMDNPVEVDFTETGDVIGTVNILQGQPRIDALVHWIEDGVYPRADQGDCIAEFDYTGELLSPIARLGHVAVSGTTRYRSRALGNEFQDNVFIAVFNTHRVVRSILTPSGSTYTSREEDFLVSDNPDFHPTDVLEDVDGSLLVIDTGGWFRIGCPTSQIAKPELLGAIYRVRKDGLQQKRRIVLNVDWVSLKGENIVNFLDDSHPPIQQQAVDVLSQRREFLEGELFQKLIPSLRRGNAVTRRNLVWAIARSELEQPQTIIRHFLGDSDESVRIVALRCLAELESAESLPLLLPRLASESRAERRVTAHCLETICLRTPPDSTQRIELTRALIQALEDSQLDRHLEHALVHALLKVGEAATMHADLEQRGSVAVQRNLLTVLSQRADAPLTADNVLPSLGSADPLLQREALRIVEQNPDWVADFTAQLVRWFSDAEDKDVPWTSVRGVLMRSIDRDDIRKVISDAMLSESTTTRTRLFLFEILDQAVTSEKLSDWFAVIPAGLAHADVAVRQQTLQLLRKETTGRFDATAIAMFQSEDADIETRLLALQATAPRMAQPDRQTIRFLLDQILINESDNTLRSLRAVETLAAIPQWNAGLIAELANSLPAFPALVLPQLSSRIRGASDAALQETYLQQILSEEASDQLTPEEVAAWNEGVHPETIRGLLQRIGEARAKQAEDRRQRLESLAALLTGGNPQKGEQVFLSRTAACSGCHRIADQGGRVGPDLSQIGRIRTPHDLLEAIVFPSASFARGYEPYNLVTGDGRILNGIIPAESASEIVVRTADLREHRVRRDQIEIFIPSSVSVMPQGIDRLLTADELRDLLAYLSERK